MSFIAILGCDGSGKSAVIDAINSEWLRRGLPLRRGHWRPVICGASAAPAEDPHAKTPRGVLMSCCKLGWLALNWWLGWFDGLRSASRKGVVLFDRYHADLLIDPLRYRYGGPMFLARLASRLMPQPDLVIFLDADEDVLISRKQEVSREALAESRRRYLDLVGALPKGRVIDASRPLNEVIAAVLGLIDNRNEPEQRDGDRTDAHSTRHA